MAAICAEEADGETWVIQQKPRLALRIQWGRADGEIGVALEGMEMIEDH